MRRPKEHRMRKTEQIGIITLGDKIHVSDPCYETDCWCAGTLEHVLPGRYRCKIMSVPEDWCGPVIKGIYSRVKSLSICHEDYQSRAKEYIPFDVGVDSGQAGFYDADYYALYHQKGAANHCDGAWYKRACDITRTRVSNPGFIEKETYLKAKLGEDYVSTDDTLDLYRKRRENEITDEQLHGILRRRFDMEEAYSMEACGWPTIGVGYAGILDDRCVVSSSGYGDGGYDCYVGRNAAGQIVSAQIVFI